VADESDEILVRRSARGDERAFLELVRRYEQPLATLIRYQVTSLDDADDVLQETLIDAWTGISLLRNPESVRAWLMQVARNRCRDHLRSPRRRELPTDTNEIERHSEGLAYGFVQRRALVMELEEAMLAVPAREREAARLFYLDGFTISEIAERHRCPEGTIKRRLFDARETLRAALGVTVERSTAMTTPKTGSRKQPFPLQRPEIAVGRLDEAPFAVDCRELRWSGVVPEVGTRSLLALYRPPEWRLNSVTGYRAARPATVHLVQGVEIEERSWKRDSGWADTGRSLCGRLTDEKAQWLAEVTRGERCEVRTFLDQGFVWAYPEFERKLEDTGLVRVRGDGSYEMSGMSSGLTEAGAGLFSVAIGEGEFTCLRVIVLEGPVTSPDTVCGENYLTREGRTVFSRYYCGPHHADRFALDPKTTITIDGVTLVHWYDQVTGVAMGLG